MDSYTTDSTSPMKKMEIKILEPSDIPRIEEPEDKGNVAYYLMILFGIGALLPWNAVLTALDFFTEKVTLHHNDVAFSLWVISQLLFLALQSTAC